MRVEDVNVSEVLPVWVGLTAGARFPQGLSREESLELLALSEVIIRKAGYGRQATVRSARGRKTIIARRNSKPLLSGR